MKAWEQYLAELIGAEVRARPDVEAARRLPVFLSSLYDVYRGTVMDRQVKFLIPKHAGEPPVSEVPRLYDVLRRDLEGDMAFVLPSASPAAVKRMVQKHVPFVVPGIQAFLPFSVVSLRTPNARAAEENVQENPLSPRAQALLLFHLLKRSLNGLTQNGIADHLNWNSMTVSRAIRELNERHLCIVKPRGVANVILLDAGRALWERAERFLVDPVRKRCYVRGRALNARRLVRAAGLNGLAHYSMLSEESLSVFAIHRSRFKRAVDQGEIVELKYRDKDAVSLELWTYDPRPISDGRVVDRLSLYLSLRYDPDERVQGALKELMEGVQWSRA